MTSDPISAQARPRARAIAQRASAPMLAALSLLAPESAFTGEQTYRSPRGFTVPIGEGYTRFALEELGELSEAERRLYEVGFQRDSTETEEAAVTLVIGYAPVPDWGLRGMAGVEKWIDEITPPRHPGFTVERFTTSADKHAAPDRFESELVGHLPDGTKLFEKRVMRAGRDGFAVVSLSGLLSDERSMRKEWPALREGLVFDPGLRYSQLRIDSSPKNLLIKVILGLLALAVIAALKAGWKRMRTPRLPRGTRSRTTRGVRRSGSGSVRRRLPSEEEIEDITDEDSEPPPPPRPPPRRPRPPGRRLIG